jgi:hypothetical protein
MRGADCDTRHHLVVENVGDRLAVSKEQCKILIRRDSRHSTNDMRYHVMNSISLKCEIASRNLDDDVDIKRSLETCREIIKISAKENLGYHE